MRVPNTTAVRANMINTMATAPFCNGEVGYKSSDTILKCGWIRLVNFGTLLLPQECRQLTTNEIGVGKKREKTRKEHQKNAETYTDTHAQTTTATTTGSKILSRKKNLLLPPAKYVCT